MVAIVKPDFENIWASEGGVGNPTLDQILSGWKQNQFPPSEISNFLQKKIETAISYLYQCGLPDWDKKIEYQKTSLVRYGNLHYIAKTVNRDKTPNLSTNDWAIAFDRFGASDDLRAMVNNILNVDGHLPFYVRKNDPVMYAKAKAPSFEAGVGISEGFNFKNYSSGMRCVGGDLILQSGGVVNGRIKNTPPTLEMNDDTLVTTALLNKVIEQIKKETQIPIGWSVITSNKKPPSDKDQLGYGTWIMDAQGKSIVGVSAENAIGIPEWTRGPDSVFGEYVHTMTIPEIARHRDTFPADDQLIEQFDLERNPNLVGRRYDATSTTSKDYASGWTYLPYVGESKPFNVVQPSQTKFVWTRTA